MTFIDAHGSPGVMPKQRMFREQGRTDLLNALRRHGGIREVARVMSLRMTTRRKPAGYWRDFANLEKELRAFIARDGQPGLMPSQPELIEAGRADLENAIKRQGGHYAVAERLGLEIAHAAKPLGYWVDFANVEQELRAFVAEQGQDGMMPTTAELIEAERYDLKYGIERNGGFREVAERVGLQTKSGVGIGDEKL